MPDYLTPKQDDFIDGHNLTFDPGDKLNGSLYLAEPFNTQSGICREEIISAMRSAQLWSDADPKQVPDGQRQAYKDQLELVDAIRYQTDQGQFSIARFDHPKFPSDDGRWSDWQRFFDARYTRVDSAT